MTDDPETARARAEAKFQKKQLVAEEGAEARKEGNAEGHLRTVN